ncbi:unnamed protein product [Paramecium primaurelia]|uniref:Uncharacterized protein n=1 Tax=Paramecium primaurelia TaxID=5886 RepID=A0A8S1N300_PARPR|nr:unnamed protein product [Paramecium primaurelia]
MKPLNKNVQVIHDWHDGPVRVNLKKYWKKNPLDYIQLPKPYSQKNKITYSKRIINDFVEVVNNRQEMVNGIVETANHFQLASSKIQDCFAEFYGPETHYQQELDRVLDNVKPEFRYIKAIAHQNLKKIHSLLRKQKHETQQELHPFKIMTKKDKLFLLSDPKNADILKSDSRQSRTETVTITPGEDKFTSQYKIMIQKEHQREQQKQNMIQIRLFDSQLKYQGDDFVKQNIFKSNMKHTYTPKNIDKNYYVNNLRHSTQESVEFKNPSHFKTAIHSRHISKYTSPNGSQDMIIGYDTIKEDKVNPLQYSSEGNKKRSYRSFKDLINQPKEIEIRNMTDTKKYTRTSSQPILSHI